MSQEHEHLRHKPASPLQRPRPLIVACPPMRSAVNLSRIVRVAGCCGVRQVLACGSFKLDRRIARDAADYVELTMRRSLPAPLKQLQEDGYQLVGLEQATQSVSLHEFAFPHRCVLVIGHERLGIEPPVLQLLDHVVEIPVYGQPLSYNAATATAMALYEYCRQYPTG
jgi:tRNA G18 (ribose-2'-O)-methylase SpoU